MLSQELMDAFNAAIGVLELEPNDSLRRDIEALYQSRSAFQIAVFAPFNYGKSTLLNAILGQRALPIDLVPTTGAAIRVSYGETLETRIQFTDGRELMEAGTDVLKQFAILDDDRRMRDDVSSVEVFCPHPFLQSGVELIDLPGTNDREAQDDLVRTQLFKADLVIQVLDGRKLMTLGEREQLRDWLLDRGIKTVVFVVNFLNLLEAEDQKQVYHRLRFVAESFRAELPNGVSNLYRVDALPALRSRLKGDQAAAQSSGLPMFETALQTIVAHSQSKQETQPAKVQRRIDQVKQALQTKINTIETQLKTESSVAQQRFEIQQKAKALIEKGFAASVLEFHTWLDIDHLLASYQAEAASALQSQAFKTWETGEFKRRAINYQQSIVKWVHQACEIFERERPNQLLVKFPELQIEIPSHSTDSAIPDEVPIAVATGLGWVLGGPIGAAVLGSASYILDKALDQFSSSPDTKNNTQIYQELAREYLIHFSQLNLAVLADYQKIAERTFAIETLQPKTSQDYELHLLRSVVERFG